MLSPRNLHLRWRARRLAVERLEQRNFLSSTNPVVVGFAPSELLITDANVGPAGFSLTITYDQSMYTAVRPNISFNPSVWSTLHNPTGRSGWANDTTYVAVYDVADANVTVGNISVTVQGALSSQYQYDPDPLRASDYLQMPYYSNWPPQPGMGLQIDTLDASVMSATPNPTTVSDATAAAIQPAFSMTLAYEGAMNTSIPPTISIIPPSLTGSTLTRAGGKWIDNQHYVATYNVIDANVSLSGPEFDVTGAQDLAGHVQPEYFGGYFQIDTENPQQLSVEGLADDTGNPNDLITTDGSLTLDNLEPGATVEYQFSRDGGPWSSWSTNGTPAPIGATTAVSVEVRQRDAAGNAGPASAPFSYTLDAPAVSSEYPSVTTVTTAQVGNTFVVTVYYNEPMWMLAPAFSPTVTFTGNTPEETAAINATLTNGGKQWDNSLRFEEDFEIANADAYVPHVHIGVTGGYDAVGNQPAPFQGTDDFAINMQVTPPTVIYAQASIQRLSLVNVGGTDTFQVHIKYDPADAPLNTMLLASRPTITFVADTPELTAQANATLIPDLANSTWSGSGSDYIAYYNVVNTGAVVPNVDMKISGAIGAYSYVTEQWYDQARFVASGAFSIDMTKSEQQVSVQSTWGTYQLVTNAAAAQPQPAYWVRINYAHPMSIGIQPTVTLNGSTPDETTAIRNAMSFSYGTWTSTQTYMAYYTVNGGSDVAKTGVYVGAAGAHDLVGNVQVPFLSTTPVFTLDTHDATPDLSDVTNLGSSMSSITVHEIGSQLYLEIVYSQTMDISSSPTFQFLDGAGNPTGVPGATVYQNYPASYWGSDHVYWAFFDIQNPYAGQDPPGIIFRNVGVKVTGARDITGRDQTPYQKLKIFDIDTLSPTVASLPSAASVTPSLSVITAENAGEAKFYVRIDYDRPMWGGLAPEVSFVPDPNTQANITALANTLTPFADYSGWGNYDSASHGYTTYWQWYSVTDVNVSIPFVGVKIRGAVDMTANPQQWFEGSGFRISMSDDASPLTNVGRIANPSHIDAVLASGAFSPGLTPSPSSTNQESAALTSADYALLYGGTWLEA